MPERTLRNQLRFALTAPLLLTLVCLFIAVIWIWLGRPVPTAAYDGPERLQCISYAPFRGDQSPLSEGTFVSAAQIEDDLRRLKQLTDCIRTYSIEHGLHQVPAVAQRVGMRVMQGIWLSSQPDKNRQQVETVIELTKRFPDVIQSVIVGNEVLLRGELSGPDLAAIIRSVKMQVTLPVTYADVWEFWLRHREIFPEVDFVTIHILPYWEDFPIPAKNAVAHIASIREKMGAALPGKDILIGETGWPSQGRMREGALPSPIHQAAILQDTLALAKQRGYRVNVIEAFDQPWKRRLEGTVGGYWGLFDDATREPKFRWGEPVSNHPYWRWQLGAGILLALLIFGAAAYGGARGPGVVAPSPLRWAAVAVTAAAGGAMIGLAAERMLYESLGIGGWTRSIALVTAAALMPLAGAIMLMRNSPLLAFAEVLSRARPVYAPAIVLVFGLLAIAVTVLALQVALGLVFDPRYRDFTYAPLTAAIIPLALVAWMNPSTPAARTAERLAGAALALSAIYILFNETLANWQSIWFCAVIGLLALTLLLRRAARDAQSSR